MVKTKATRARRAIDGKPVWYGVYQANDGSWRKAASQYGTICYTTPDYALAGAEHEAREALRVHGVRLTHGTGSL
jgi:hypothetical protein